MMPRQRSRHSPSHYRLIGFVLLAYGLALALLLPAYPAASRATVLLPTARVLPVSDAAAFVVAAPGHIPTALPSPTIALPATSIAAAAVAAQPAPPAPTERPLPTLTITPVPLPAPAPPA